MEEYPILLWVAVLASLFGSIQFGFHIGILNTCLQQLAQHFDYSDVTDIETSVIVGSLLVGAAIGSLPAGTLADMMGPKKLMLYNTFIFVLGGLVSAFAFSGSKGMIMFCAGRFVSGLGCGVVGVCSPRYIAEVAPMSIRGALGSLHQVFINVGIVISYLLGLPFEMWTNVPSNWWQIMLLIGAFIPLFQLLILVLVPESFRWLRMNGDIGAAHVSGEKMWGIYWEDFQTVAEPLLEWEDEKRMSQEPLPRIFSRTYSKVMLLGCSVVMFQQLSGINTVILYSRTIFMEVGLQSAILGCVFAGITNVTFTVVSGLLMDRAGRKALLIFSHGGMAICLGVISLLVWGGYGATLGPDMEPLVLFFLVVLYVIFFALGCGPIPWVYVAEIMPERIKGYGAAFATSLNWVGVIMVGFSFPPMLQALNTGPSYAIYAVLNLVFVVFFAVFMLETKQMTFSQIEDCLLLPEGGQENQNQDNNNTYNNGNFNQYYVFQVGGSNSGGQGGPSVRYFRVPSHTEIRCTEVLDQGPMRYDPTLTAKSGILKTGGSAKKLPSRKKSVKSENRNGMNTSCESRQVRFPDEIEPATIIPDTIV